MKYSLKTTADKAIVVIKGRLETREDTPKVIAMEISQPDLVLDGAPPIRIKVRPGVLTDEMTERLKEILSEHPGESQVFVHLESFDKTTVVRLGDEFCVSDRNGLYGELRVLLGPDCVL